MVTGPLPQEQLRRALEVVAYELERRPDEYRTTDPIGALEQVRAAAEALPPSGARLHTSYPALVELTTRATGPGVIENPRWNAGRCITVEYRMARGFESKDIEFQQAEAERTAQRAEPRMSDRRRAILLSLARMRADLAKATAAAHQRMIHQAIAALETDLRSFPD